jgi:feruloyl esterase
VAIHPVYDFVALQVDGTLIGQAIYNHPGAWISPAKASLLNTKVYEACDELDGIKDGVISDVRGCAAHFKPEDLRCAGGSDTGDTCLSDAQLAAVKTIASDMPLGIRFEIGDKFGRWPILEGGGAGNFSTFGRTSTPPHPPARGDSFLFMMGDQMVRHMAMRDPAYDSLTFNPAAHAEALQTLSKQMDNASVDLSAFRRHGGKLLLMHGTVDMAVTPYNTIAYYDRLKAQFKPDELRSFMRFYVAPGFGHGDGPFVVGWDSLGALDAWVDHGVEPAAQIAVDTARTTAGRSRPLCEYPGYPRYKGQGDPSAAASFICAQ